MNNNIEILQTLKEVMDARHNLFTKMQNEYFEAYAEDVFATACYRCKCLEIELKQGKKYVYKNKPYIVVRKALGPCYPETPTSPGQYIEPRIEVEVINTKTNKVSVIQRNAMDFILYIDPSTINENEY